MFYMVKECLHTDFSLKSSVMGKRGNVEINNSPQAGIEPGASRFKIQHSTEWAKEIYH